MVNRLPNIGFNYGLSFELATAPGVVIIKKNNENKPSNDHTNTYMMMMIDGKVDLGLDARKLFLNV